MRKRIVQAVTCAAILFGSMAQPAHAIFGVGDIVFDPSSYAELVQEAKNGAQQLQWMADLYGTAQKDLQELTNFYNLFAHVTDATQLAQVLNTQFIQSPIITDALQLEQAFSGLGLKTSLAAKINNIATRMRYYTPSSKDFAGFMVNKETLASAGQVSTAQDSFLAQTQRITGLRELMNGINTADPKRVSDITARGTIETATAVAQTNQLLATQIQQRAQKDATDLQREQAYRFSVDQLRAGAEAAVATANGGTVTLVTP